MIKKIANAPQDDSWEAKVNERIMQNTIALDNHTIKSKKFASQSTIVQIDYLDANDNESSDDIKTDSDYDENEVEEPVKPKIGWGQASKLGAAEFARKQQSLKLVLPKMNK